MSSAKPTRKGVTLHTQNPVHICEFRWIIESISKFTRKLRSSFLVESQCTPQFQIVAKLTERLPGVNNVNVGVQRTDESTKSVHVVCEMSLTNNEGDVYRNDTFNFTSSSNESPHYCFTEMFSTDLNGKMCSNAGGKDFPELRKKSLVVSYKDCDNVFLLPDDVLVVKGILKVFGCCIVTNRYAMPQVEVDITQESHIEHLLSDFRDAYEKQQFTDVEFIIDDDTDPIKAHRFVLSARSPVFCRMFESNMKEASDGKISIMDVDKPIFEALIWYFYTGIVKNLDSDEIGSLYIAADRYESFTLQQQCADILAWRIGDDSVCAILSLADAYNDEGLVDVATDYIIENFHRVNKMSEWDVLVKSNPGLAQEVLKEVAEEAVKPDYRKKWDKEDKERRKAGEDKHLKIIHRNFHSGSF